MIYKIQVVTVSQETLGLTLAEGKIILNDLQQIVVERQVSSSLLLKQACPDCGQRRCSKGNHTLSLRTVFGQLTVRSPRMHHCVCRPHETKTFSPLAELLPNHTLPRVAFPGDQVGLAHELRDDVETLARRAADCRARQYA